MARRKKGKPISGWLLIDKPAGTGSSEVVNKLRWRYQAQKAGHGGTLDPDATGLLPIAFGEATKLLPFLEDRLKAYEFSVNWGSETSTDDATGDVLETSEQRPSHEEVLRAIPQFLGEIEQTPPQVSAVKIDGERAYDLARKGEKLELKSRPLWVEELTLTDHSSDQSRFLFRCGKGGYVRSIARDLGRALGCLGHVAELRRSETLGFDVEDAFPYQPLAEGPELPELLSILETPDFPNFDIRPEDEDKIRNGNAINNAAYGLSDGAIALALIGGEAAAIIEVEGPLIHVRRGIVQT